MMKSWIYPLAALSLLTLSGCDSDDKGPGEKELYQAFLSSYNGFYQISYETQGQAQLAQLAVTPTGATLLLEDERGQQSSYSGRYDSSTETLSFGESITCSASEQSFTCDLNTLSLTLNSVAIVVQPEPAALAASYQLISAGEKVTISLDGSGLFTANMNGCVTTGEVSQSNGQLTVVETANSCGEELNSGLAYSHSLYVDNDTLEVIHPGSSLAGFWLP